MNEIKALLHIDIVSYKILSKGRELYLLGTNSKNKTCGRAFPNVTGKLKGGIFQNRQQRKDMFERISEWVLNH